MTENQIISQFKSSNALLSGHFLLTSGRHSNQYFEKFTLLSQPNIVQNLCSNICDYYKNKQIEMVVGAATGGIILAFEIGKQLRTKGIFAERSNGELIFKRGFSIRENQKILLVDDVVTTGGSIFELMNLTQKTGAEIVGIAVMFDRTGGTLDFGYPFYALHSEKIKSWEQSDCPLCKQKVPFTKRGSTGK